MSKGMKLTGGLLAKNSFLNFIGRVPPLFITVITLPYVIRGLGIERYGIFALIWVIVNYFNVFQFGLGGATTKFIAEAVGKGDTNRISAIYWTSLFFVFFLGLIGGSICFLIAPILAEYVFKVHSNLVAEMKFVFRISSVLILIILIRMVLNGVLEAYQRFDIINLIKIPSSILASIIPVIVVFIGKGLTLIVILIIIKEFMMLCGYYLFSLRVIPGGNWRLLDFKSSKPLLSFGGWLSATRILAMIMLNADKFLIGTLLSVTAVTYYSVPYNLASKMVIIGASIMPVIFPAISMVHATDNKRLDNLFINSLKSIIVLPGLPVLILTVFSREILTLWLGDDFQQSIIVLQILAIGNLMAGISWLFGTFIQGTGYPKVAAIIGLFQAPIDILLIWFLTKTFGIKGTALAWALLRGLGAFLLYMSCWKLNIFSLSWKIDSRLLKAGVSISLILGVNFILKSFLDLSILTAGGNALLLIIGYSVITWHYIVDNKQKEVILRKMKFIPLINR